MIKIVGGSGKPDFTFQPSGGVAALYSKDKMQPEHCKHAENCCLCIGYIFGIFGPLMDRTDFSDMWMCIGSFEATWRCSTPSLTHPELTVLLNW